MPPNVQFCAHNLSDLKPRLYSRRKAEGYDSKRKCIIWEMIVLVIEVELHEGAFFIGVKAVLALQPNAQSLRRQCKRDESILSHYTKGCTHERPLANYKEITYFHLLMRSLRSDSVMIFQFVSPLFWSLTLYRSEANAESSIEYPWIQASYIPFILQNEAYTNSYFYHGQPLGWQPSEMHGFYFPQYLTSYDAILRSTYGPTHQRVPSNGHDS